jgi:hypothetical protein
LCPLQSTFFRISSSICSHHYFCVSLALRRHYFFIT